MVCQWTFGLGQRTLQNSSSLEMLRGRDQIVGASWKSILVAFYQFGMRAKTAKNRVMTATSVAEARVPVIKAQVRMRVSLWLKLVYTAFMAMVVPMYGRN